MKRKQENEANKESKSKQPQEQLREKTEYVTEGQETSRVTKALPKRKHE